MIKKLYRIEHIEGWTPIDMGGNDIGFSTLEYTTNIVHYVVECWEDNHHYARSEEFKTLEEARKFMEEV